MKLLVFCILLCVFEGASAQSGVAINNYDSGNYYQRTDPIIETIFGTTVNLPQIKRTSAALSLIDPNNSISKSHWRRYEYVILLDGAIDFQTPDRLWEIIHTNRIGARFGNDKNALILLRSFGGNIGPSMRIGREIRALGFDTEVSVGCYSACVFIFAGGLKRYYFSGELGVHRASFNGIDLGYTDTYSLAADMARYFQELNVSPEFIRAMGQASPLSVNILNITDAERLGLANQGTFSDGSFVNNRGEFVVNNDFIDGSGRIVVRCNRPSSQNVSVLLFRSNETIAGLDRLFGSGWSDVESPDNNRKLYMSIFSPEMVNELSVGMRSSAIVAMTDMSRVDAPSELSDIDNGSGYQIDFDDVPIGMESAENIFLFSADADFRDIRLVKRFHIPGRSQWAQNLFRQCRR